MSIKREEITYWTDRLPDVKAAEIKALSYITCKLCQQRHGVFYKRHDENRRTLHYLCNKVKRYWMEDQHECFEYTTRLGNVEFVDGLPVQEDWTAKCKSTFQKKHTADLLK